MKLPGKRILVNKWIHGRLCVVRVRVEEVIPEFEPSEPCLEPDTLKFLDEVQRLADAGDVDALAKLGEVYVRRSA